RVDGDERNLPPVLAPGHRGLARGIGLGENVFRKDMRNAVRMDRDQADGLFAGQRAELFAHARRRYAETALLENVDGHEIAILGVRLFSGRDVQRAADLLLVDGLDEAAAAAFCTVDAELALAFERQQLDDAAGMARAFVRILFGAQQSAIAHARRIFRLFATARN